jgi:hypothetical protein
MRGACLLSRSSEDVSIFFGRLSVHCEDLLGIQLLVKKLETKRTLLDLHGRGRPEMSENTVHDIANRLLASPRKSLRILLQEIGLSRSTCQRAAKKAGLLAYQFRVVQELKQQDYDKHMMYCRWFRTFIDENPGILVYTLFSDAWFHLSGYVNSQNTFVG